MARYRQYCPVARASEILADRWTPLIVRELLAGSRHFNAIERGLPGISRSLLAGRLKHLERNGVVERRVIERPAAVEYVLTPAGEELRAVLEHLGAWGVRWAFQEPRADELDPALLLWKVHQRIRAAALPDRRTTVEFDFTGRNARRLWLVLERRDVSVCLKPPGFPSDLVGVMGTFGSSARYDDEPWGEHHEGPDAVRSFYKSLLRALPDLEIMVGAEHATPDAVVVECVIRGTHGGTWRDLPATGRRIEFPLCGVYTFDADGKLAGERIYYDRATVLRQCGVFREPTTPIGRVLLFLNHPVRLASAALRGLARRG